MNPAVLQELAAFGCSNREWAYNRKIAAQANDSLVYSITKDKSRFLDSFEPEASCENCNMCLACVPARNEKLLTLRRSDSYLSQGFKVRRFPSGEMTGGQFIRGRQGKVVPPSRSGKVVTTSFSIPARNKIRRAVENAGVDLNYFLTLTFAPSLLHPWHFNENGNVRHDYAKYKLIKFRDALNKHCKRRYNEKFLFVWVAELQKNGNIHFHMLINKRLPCEFTRKLWAVGAVNHQYINDTNHAVNYMRKYMTKDENSAIQGNRYNISAELRERMKPEETTISLCVGKEISEMKYEESVMDVVKAMREDIESRGGTVLDFGFSLPAPRRSRSYLDKKGQRKKSKGVPQNLAGDVFRLITGDDDSPF